MPTSLMSYALMRLRLALASSGCGLARGFQRLHQQVGAWVWSTRVGGCRFRCHEKS